MNIRFSIIDLLIAFWLFVCVLVGAIMVAK